MLNYLGLLGLQIIETQLKIFKDKRRIRWLLKSKEGFIVVGKEEERADIFISS